MPSLLTTDKLPAQDPAEYESWCTRVGIYRPAIRYGPSTSHPEAGLGVFATDAIEVGDEFLSVPLEVIMTEEAAKGSTLGKVVAQVNEERSQAKEEGENKLHRISTRTLLYCFLIHSRADPTSPFHPWLVHGVPRSYDLPLTWSSEEQALLKGSNLGEAVPHRLQQLQAKWRNAKEALCTRVPDLMPEEVLTWENFLWAHCTYSSRGFPAQLADPALAPGAAASASTSSSSSSSPSLLLNSSSGPIPSSSTHLGCMLPYLDLTNHRPFHPITWVHHPVPSGDAHPHDKELATGQGNAEAVQRRGRVALRAGQRIPVGEEVLNNYGAKANEEFLMGYGFTLPHNAADELTLAVAARAVQGERLALIQAAGLQLHQAVRRDGNVDELLMSMRVCAMDEAELQRFSAVWVDKCAPGLLPAGSSSSASELKHSLSFISSRNELTTLLTLRTLLLGRLRRLQLGDPETLNEIPTELSLDVQAGATMEQVQVRTLLPSFFRQFNECDEEARVRNAQSANNYHIECALNYRIGQREVLLAAAGRTEQLINDAANRAMEEVKRAAEQVLYLQVDMDTTVASTESSAEDAQPSRKKRKTGRAAKAATAVAAEGEKKTIRQLLDAYQQWLSEIGAHVNADWSSGQWKLATDYIPASTTSSTGQSSSTPLLSLPLSHLITPELFSSSSSFQPCMDLIEGLDESQVTLLFLLHERSKGAESRWHPWIEHMAALPTAVHSEEGEEVERMTQEAALYEIYSQLFPSLSSSYPTLFPPSTHSWSHFLWAANLVQSHRVQWMVPGQGMRVGVLPVPFMPVPVDAPVTCVDSVKGAADSEEEEEKEGEEYLIFRSLVPLSSGSLLSLSVPSPPVWSDLLSHSNQIRPVSAAPSDSASSAFLLPFTTLVEFFQEVLQQQMGEEEEGKDDEEEEEEEELAASKPPSTPFGLALQPPSQRHQQLWNKLQLDDGSNFHLRPSFTPAVLQAVVRSFFLSSSQLKALTSSAATATSAVASAASSSSSGSSLPLGRSRVDDSDEETEEEAQEQGEEGEAEEDEDEEEEEEMGEEEDEAASASPPSASLLSASSRLFLLTLLQHQLAEYGASTKQAAPPVTRALSSAQLQASWRAQQQRLLQAILNAARQERK